MTSDSTKEIIKKIQNGDEDSFVDLYDLFYKKAYYIALKITNCDADAQDIAQETFMEIKNSIHSLREPGAFYSWMCRIIISKCHVMFRKNRSTTMDPLLIQSLDGYQEFRSYMMPEKTSRIEGEKEILAQLMNSLRPEFREVLVLLYFCQFKQTEVSRILDLPIGTVKSRSKHARTELIKLIKDFEKKEGRKLNFNTHAFGTMVSSVFIIESGIAIPTFTSFSLIGYLKLVSDNIIEYCKSSALNAATVLSTTVMVTTGVAFAAEDIMAANDEPINEISKAPKIKNDEVPNENQLTSRNIEMKEVEEVKTFQATSFRNSTVSSNIEAYYAILNFAEDEEQLRMKTKDELLKIKPVVEEFRNAQSAYYELLEHRGWFLIYEELVNS